MTPISLVCPYYEDARRLFDFIWNENNFKYFDEIIIVDDGSYDHPAKETLVDFILDNPEYRDRLRLFRIPVDYGFNAHGARNLGMRFVRNEWCSLLDIDNEITEGFCEQLHRSIESCPRDSFLIHNIDRTPDKDTLNHFSIREWQFWRVKGYDEECMGIHYGDRIFRYRLDAMYRPIMMPPPYLIMNRPMHHYKHRDDCRKIVYNKDNSMTHPPEKYRIVWEKFMYERNEDRTRWHEIEKHQSKFMWYEVDLECHQLELDLGESAHQLRQQVYIDETPFAFLLRHLMERDKTS
jgi:glycosyltransferase involved in cell wall biosynthesis